MVNTASPQSSDSTRKTNETASPALRRRKPRGPLRKAGIERAERRPQIAADGGADGGVFPDLGRVDVDVQDFRLGRIAVDVGHQALGKARAYADKQIAAAHRAAGISGRMHPDDAGAERAVPRKSADAHRRQPDGA